MDALAVGILGYGRFGRAFGALLEASGYAVRALDPVAPVPPPRGVASIEELAAVSRTLVLAMPVSEIGRALDGLAPHLGPGHLVFDVGSVKTRPAAAMDARLGDRVPWVASHPMFGPTSLALGERPLRAVVCPNARHPHACDEVRRLYERIGCQVIALDAETHDRAMAESHALAYFIAKALLDAGADMDSEIAPPSARALARTVEAVRSDAGHLLATLHRENPFAADARRRFLDALHAVDRALDDESDLSIPGLENR